MCSYILLEILITICRAVYETQYIRTPLIWINWVGKPSGYTENLDNQIFL